MSCKHQWVETLQQNQLGGSPIIQHLPHCNCLEQKNEMVSAVLSAMGVLGSIDTDHCSFYQKERYCPFSDGKQYTVEVFVGNVRQGGMAAKLDAKTGLSISEGGCPTVSIRDIPNIENVVFQSIARRNTAIQPVENNISLQVIPKP